MNRKSILYVQMSDCGAPERVYAAFLLAADAVAMGMKATIYFFLKGVTAVKKGESEKIKLEGYPPLRQIIDRAVNAGVELEVCEQSCMLLGLKKQDLIDSVKIVGASSINDRVLDADGVLYF